MGKRRTVTDGEYGDSKYIIEKCLNCIRPECTNCVDSAESRFETADLDTLSENEKLYEMVLSENAMTLLKYYPTGKSDSEIARTMGLSCSTIQNIRWKMKLPSARKTTEEERRELIKPWIRPEPKTV